jgi:hypothetical protein
MKIPTLGPSLTTTGVYKFQNISAQLRNEDSFPIAAGTPVILAANGTDDGVAIFNLSSFTAGSLDGLTGGLAVMPIAINQVGEVVCYGMVQNALVVVMTRSASTAVWASFPGIAVGDVLSQATAVNALTRSSAGTQLGYGPFYNAMQAVASGTTQASGFTRSDVFSTVLTTGSATNATLNALCAGTNTSVSGFKVFVRAM